MDKGALVLFVPLTSNRSALIPTFLNEGFLSALPLGRELAELTPIVNMLLRYFLKLSEHIVFKYVSHNISFRLF